MSVVWLSTLKNLSKNFSVSADLLIKKFPELDIKSTDDDCDKQMEISKDNKKWLDSLCEQNFIYDEVIYQQEYLNLLKKITDTEHSIEALENTPFRQLRNAFGFSGGVFGGINLFLANAIVVSATAVFTLLIMPPVLLGAFVYWRGRREEKKINADLYADCLDRKINLLCKHRESVILRRKNHSKLILQDFLQTKPKPQKEKRSVLGNPLSHFIGASFSTMCITYAVIKYGFIAGLVAGGPVAWGVAVGLGLFIGAYFAYKRYTHLSCKIRAEKNMAALAARENDINILKNSVELSKNSDVSIKKRLGFYSTDSTVEVKPECVHQEKEIKRKRTNSAPRLTMESTSHVTVTECASVLPISLVF